MTKKIGITCDTYKVSKFRAGLLKDGFKLEYDGKSGIEGAHLFRVECKEKDFKETAARLQKTLKRLEIECKQSN
jgi:hypothetical protein